MFFPALHSGINLPKLERSPKTIKSGAATRAFRFGGGNDARHAQN
jgi:hypothetical protein